MNRLFLSFLFFTVSMFHIYASTASTLEPTQGISKDSFPVLTFEEPFIDIGHINAGDIVEFDINFENIGESPLIIEVVTACKCLDITWPRDAVLPKEKGIIKVVFDSMGVGKGEFTKVIDIIANTNPIVVEAMMKGVID